MSDAGTSPQTSFRHGPFQGLVGYDIVHDERGLYFTLEVRRDLLNPHGVVHGGVTLTLPDAACGRSLIGLRRESLARPSAHRSPHR